MTIQGYDKVLHAVYAIKLEKAIIYGAIKNNRLTALGIEPLDTLVIDRETRNRLEAFVAEHHLLLVHWRSRTAFSSPAAISKYLSGNR